MPNTWDSEYEGNQFGFACPKCLRNDRIEIAATVWVLLTEDGSDADESESGAHEWDDDSAAQCGACNWQGRVKDLDQQIEDTDDEATA